jgi:hypothetical protein
MDGLGSWPTMECLWAGLCKHGLTAISFTAGSLGLVVTVARLLLLRPLRFVMIYSPGLSPQHSERCAADLHRVRALLPDLRVVDYEHSVILTLS